MGLFSKLRNSKKSTDNTIPKAVLMPAVLTNALFSLGHMFEIPEDVLAR